MSQVRRYEVLVRCRNCGENHEENDCENKLEPICLHLQGTHTATDRSFNTKGNLYMAFENITFYEARQIIRGNKTTLKILVIFHPLYQKQMKQKFKLSNYTINAGH
ncbi:hypothetical protein WA026_021432 [Henosepilachna vigintioctopunctata]|uniref:Uncharacterized protein n=1 Tax=Henosepilachna vigintioctopunctata TaxID=420089 RepID=A0AAW1TQV8_9CUCU